MTKKEIAYKRHKFMEEFFKKILFRMEKRNLKIL